MGGFPYVAPSGAMLTPALPIVGGASSAGASGTDFGKATLTHGMQRQAAAANTAAAASIPGVAGRFSWLSFVMFWVGTAATAGTVTCTLAGLPVVISQFDLTWTTTQGDRIIMVLGTPMQGNTIAVGITATVPATGASGPACGVEMYGFQL